MELSARQLAKVLKRTKRTIQRRSVREQWPFYFASGLGGKHRVYNFEHLPNNVKFDFVRNLLEDATFVTRIRELSAAEMQMVGEQMSNDETQQLDTQWMIKTHRFAIDQPVVPEWFLNDKEGMRFEFVRLALTFANELKLSKIAAFDQFAQAYNAQQLPLQLDVYDAKSTISRISLLRWQYKIKHDKQIKTLNACQGTSIAPAITFEGLINTLLGEMGLSLCEHNIRQLKVCLQNHDFDVAAAIFD